MSEKSGPFQTSDSQSWKAEDMWSGKKREGSQKKSQIGGQGLKKKKLREMVLN